MPGAGRTREPCVQKKVHFAHARQQQGSRDNRHSLRNGASGLFRALPGVPGLLAPVASGFVTQGLMPASGHQDHTTSPSAPAALVCRNQSVHRIPHSTFVTTRTPLS
jgi:hypothetical protein